MLLFLSSNPLPVDVSPPTIVFVPVLILYAVVHLLPLSLVPIPVPISEEHVHVFAFHPLGIAASP